MSVIFDHILLWFTVYPATHQNFFDILSIIYNYSEPSVAVFSGRSYVFLLTGSKNNGCNVIA